ncbi:MAG: PD-(D/E)XK nuclease family protein [Chloroflexota bacterium]|nr:PD-(D/E)XK nuclease family protein [Chloroflexota bacterium]MDE2841086.1 PD-(D/E)XK nuclease family protein [Chloroflexota bacterium]MDE2929928.1 PD-(D/E)XK nuclease family protein [Chloroflexota bacterium]
MARPLRRLSPSSTRAYERCPQMYHLRYNERVRVPSTAAQLLGSAVHTVIEMFYKEKRDGKALDVEAAFDVLDDALDATLHELDEEGRAEVEELRELGYDLVEYYLDEVAPHIRPHLIEERFSFNVPGVDVPMVGYVDLVDQDGTVIDHKTAASPFPADYLAHDIQLLTYSLGYNALRLGARQRPGQLPLATMLPPVRLDVMVKGEEITYQRLDFRYEQEHLEQYVERVNAVAAGIRTADFRPFWQIREPDPDVCHYCDFNSVCTYRLPASSDEPAEGGESDSATP